MTTPLSNIIRAVSAVKYEFFMYLPSLEIRTLSWARSFPEMSLGNNELSNRDIATDLADKILFVSLFYYLIYVCNIFGVVIKF